MSLHSAFANKVDRTYTQGIDTYVAGNYIEAKKWIRRAAGEGSVDGMSIYGVMYLYGRGVAQDGGKAVYWLTRAAKAGEKDAQSLLGIMYAMGQGMDKDLEKG